MKYRVKKLRQPLLLSLTTLSLLGVITPTASATPTKDIQQAVEHLATDNSSVIELTDRLVVTFKESTSDQEKAEALHEVSREIDTVSQTTIVKDKVAEDTTTVVVQTDTALDPAQQQEAITALEENPQVETAEPDKIVKAVASAAQSEPGYSYLWAYGANYVNPVPAWNRGYTGKNQTIGIIDTGWTSHPDLSAPVASYDFVSSPYISRDGNGRDPDARDTGNLNANANWHGSFIQGQLAAKVNGSGIAGIAHDADIVHARALGIYGTGYVSDIADAIIWAAGGSVTGIPNNHRPVNVINASLAYPSNQCSSTMSRAINFALSKNIPVVVASGNNGGNASYYEPANCYRAIVVGASTSWGALATYSNYGSMLDLVAPGGTTGIDIYSTTNTGWSLLGLPSYGNKNGTSMAAPYVTGTIALMKQANPHLTVEQIRKILVDTGKPVAGYRQVNAAAAVDAAVKAVPPSPSFRASSAPSIKPESGIASAYYRYGGQGRFGAPTGNEFPSILGGAIQHFERSMSLYWTPRYGAHPMYWAGAIGNTYRLADYERGYGYPITDEIAVPGGSTQKFVDSSGRFTSLYWGASHHRVHKVWEAGAIGAKYTAEGAAARFGVPHEDEVAIHHGVRQTFIHGSKETRFYWSPQTGAHSINGQGAIFHHWVSQGGLNTDGFPTTDEIAIPGGSYQIFSTARGTQTGYWWSESTGSQRLNTNGAIYWHWRNNGYTSVFGYPVSSEAHIGNGVYQVKFSGGQAINWSANGGTWVSRW
ncbi:S8 family serine peptidase [Rothia sp. ZJ932]|uniref:S8 family serine peptidase n=1 Tax=Rothia sp. ZJ932 TaxID=2810516 RepID=UPI0019682F9D|nr:S8 family serine peptidase [Rothia sp. ZJ932]QRZ61803.1 S8 family serine peptidase [Rothia sp. ZJ932]